MNVVIQIVTFLNVMLSVVMLNVIVQSVVAPIILKYYPVIVSVLDFFDILSFLAKKGRKKNQQFFLH
jgi:hypothetical protein